LEHLPCDGDLGHLEDNIAAVAHHLRADLDQLVTGVRKSSRWPRAMQVRSITRVTLPRSAA